MNTNEKMRRNFVYGCVLDFSFFVFHAKSATINIHHRELSDIFY